MVMERVVFAFVNHECNAPPHACFGAGNSYSTSPLTKISKSEVDYMITWKRASISLISDRTTETESSLSIFRCVGLQRESTCRARVVEVSYGWKIVLSQHLDCMSEVHFRQELPLRELLPEKLIISKAILTG
jgi:hypothetical protein